MKNYPKKTIGELCNIVKGETGIASAIAGEYPLVVTAKDRKTSATYQFDTQAVCIPLVSSSGHGKKSLNYVHYQEGKFALGTILAAVIPKNHDEISAAFLHQYLLFYKDIKIVPLMRGAANVSLAVKDIAKIEIPLPPIDEQKDFIVFFNKLQKFNDELVQEFDKQENYVSQLKQAILQEAIAGQLTAEWRTENPMQKGNPDTDAAALLAKIKAEKQRLIADGKLKKEKTLAEIAIDEIPCHLPNGWMWCRIDSLVFSLRHDLRTGPFGSSLHKHDHKLEGIPVLGIESIDRNGKITGKNKIFVDSEKGEELATFSVKGGDIILSRSGTVGEICRIPDEFEYGLISTNLMKISLDKRVVLADFFCLLFKGSKTIEKQLFTLCVGSTRLFLTQTILSKLLFPLPPLAEQKAIVEKVDKLMNVIDRLEQQIKHRKQLAENLMQTVLREAFE